MKYIKAPGKDVASYLTPGRKYPIMEELGDGLYRIRDDDRDPIVVYTRGSVHANGQSWEVIERRPTDIERHAGAYRPIAAVLLFIAVSIAAALILGGGQ